MNVITNLDDDITDTSNSLVADFIKRGASTTTPFNIVFHNLSLIKHELHQNLTVKSFADIKKQLHTVNSAFYKLNHSGFPISYKTLDNFKYLKKDNKRFVAYYHKLFDKQAIKNIKSKSSINLTQSELGAVNVAMSREWSNQLLRNNNVSRSNAKTIASAYHKITGQNIKHVTELLLNVIGY